MELKNKMRYLSRFNNLHRYKLKPCRGRQNGGWDFATAGTERVKGERELAEEIKSTPPPPETDGVSGCACGTINNNLVRVRAQSHFKEMGRDKRAGRWRAVVWPHLHIDDGNMGGGGTIPFIETLNKDEERDSYFNMGLDGKNRGIGFTSNRRNTYHYCIIAYRNDDKGVGEGDFRGDSFQIFMASQKKTKLLLY